MIGIYTDKLSTVNGIVFPLCTMPFVAKPADTGAESASHAEAPDQMWLDDITYLWTTEDSVFTCWVLDLFTRRLSAGRLSHTWGALLP